MADKIGEEYDGMINGVTSFGFFVELIEPPVEGLVRVATLGDDYYVFDEKGHALIGDRTRKRFRLGDMVKVRVESVSVERRRIDFSLLDMAERKRSGRGDRPARGKRRGDERKRGALKQQRGKPSKGKASAGKKRRAKG
jgi:ribonuclease R